MAGEWISVDCCLSRKPELVELMAATGTPADVAIGRLVQFWSWCQLEASGGVAKGTPATVALIAGGDAEWWLAVEAAGWVKFCDDKTLKIPGWDERFSCAAKERMKANQRQQRRRDRDTTVTTPLHDRDSTVTRSVHDRDSTVTAPLRDRDATVTRGEERIGEEKREELPPSVVATSNPPKRRKRSSPPDKIKISWSADAGWAGITEIDRSRWRVAYPACDLAAEIARMHEWLLANPEKANKRNWRSFVVRWLTRSQERGGGMPSRRPDEHARRPVVSTLMWRDDACRNMTDEQYATWRSSQRQKAV